MNLKATRTIEKYNMLKKGSEVVAGFSGGADSVALLYFLHTHPWGFKVKAAHLNHNLRDGESLRDQQFAEAFCKKYGIEFLLKSVDIKLKAEAGKKSVEECAREERYMFFKEAACTSAVIATAHTLSDSAETAVFNMIRGTGLKGICGIPPVRDNIIRPLIECTRGDIEDYCRDNGLDYVTDSTNLTDDYTRNKIRHNIIPHVLEINPGFYASFLKTAEILGMEEDYLTKKARDAMSSIKEERGYDRGKFLKLDSAIKNRVVIELLKDSGLNYFGERIESIIEIIGSAGVIQLSAGYFLSARGERFEIIPRKEEPVQEYFEVKLDFKNPPKRWEVSVCGTKKVRFELLECEEIINYSQTRKNVLKYMLDYDKIDKIVLIRQKRAGDKIALMGRGCTKSVKKLLSESKIPAELRSRLVLIDDGSVLWLEKFGAAEKARVTDKTKKALFIEVVEDLNAK